jgi:hypothetical protein
MKWTRWTSAREVRAGFLSTSLECGIWTLLSKCSIGAADADVAAIRTAYNNKAAIDMQVLDNLIANDGVGIRASWKVFQFPSGQELRGAQTFDVVMKPCYATNNPALIDP